MSLLALSGTNSVSGGYEIDNSLKIEPDNSEHLTKSQSNGNKTTWTCSFWFKRTELNDSEYPAFISASSSSWQTRIAIFNDGRLWVDLGYGTSYYRNLTNLLLRDTSAWYHVVVAVDSTQGTASDRLNVYLNGELITSWNTQNYPAQNTEFKFFDSNHAMFIGTTTATDYRFAGYLAEMHVIDGTQLAQTDFGEFDDDSGIWKPKAYTGSYGSQGFYLDFSDAANLGDDASGNGNNFTENNITAADQSTDTPTNNFCTWNPLWVYASQPIISEGATKVRYSDSTDEGAKATMGLTNGKWYWEAKPVGTIGSQYIGIQTDGDSNIASAANSLLNNYTMVINPTGRYYSYSGSLSESSAGQFTSLTTSDWLGIALDMDSSTQTIKYYVNGSLILTRDLISEMQGQTVFPFLVNYENRSFDINFGGYTINTISSAAADANDYGTFEYAPPSGYYALCTKNLAEYG
jgi:hypothetical protein